MKGYVFWFPLLLTGAESEFVGARSCAPCHMAIYNTQKESRHARSLRPAGSATELTSSLPFSFVDRATGAELLFKRTSEGGIELSAQESSEQHRLLLRWAFGSGAQGITAVGVADDNRRVEARLTWYRSLGTFDLTTGATRYTPTKIRESLGRSLSEEELQQCFGCHSSRVEMGVRCERCHGPGNQHVVAGGSMADRKILNPGKLDAFGQVRMCGECHGKPPEDTDIAGLRAIESNPNTARFASPRLVLSRCFNESAAGLRCSECHDPHRDAARDHAGYDRKCLGCHDRQTRRRATVCRQATERCSSCHMPPARVMAHSSFTDHWIRVVR